MSKTSMNLLYSTALSISLSMVAAGPWRPLSEIEIKKVVVFRVQRNLLEHYYLTKSNEHREIIIVLIFGEGLDDGIIQNRIPTRRPAIYCSGELYFSGGGEANMMGYGFSPNEFEACIGNEMKIADAEYIDGKLITYGVYPTGYVFDRRKYETLELLTLKEYYKKKNSIIQEVKSYGWDSKHRQHMKGPKPKTETPSDSDRP